MIRQAYRYRFSENVDLRDAQDTLLLALLAAEGLFGRARVRMDATWAVDPSINTIAVDASTIVGLTVSLIFTAFITAEFGRDAFDVRRVELVVAFMDQEIGA
jgi:hypothetical protein